MLGKCVVQLGWWTSGCEEDARLSERGSATSRERVRTWSVGHAGSLPTPSYSLLTAVRRLLDYVEVTCREWECEGNEANEVDEAPLAATSATLLVTRPGEVALLCTALSNFDPLWTPALASLRFEPAESMARRYCGVSGVQIVRLNDVSCFTLLEHIGRESLRRRLCVTTCARF